MNKTIEIANPDPGGRWYTSVKKAQEYVDRGRAYMSDGMLVFLSAANKRTQFEEVAFWNGAPKPLISKKINIRRVLDTDCGPMLAMR